MSYMYLYIYDIKSYNLQVCIGPDGTRSLCDISVNCIVDVISVHEKKKQINRALFKSCDSLKYQPSTNWTEFEG